MKIRIGSDDELCYWMETKEEQYHKPNIKISRIRYWVWNLIIWMHDQVQGDLLVRYRFGPREKEEA